MQTSFNTTPTLIDDVKHDMRTNERILRWIAVKQKALRPLKEYKAKDPRNLNLPTAPEPVPVVPTRPPAKYPLFSEERKARRNARRKAAAASD